MLDYQIWGIEVLQTRQISLTSVVSDLDIAAFTPLAESKYTKVKSSKRSQGDLLDDGRREHRYEQ
jgi:hypothetical protein